MEGAEPSDVIEAWLSSAEVARELQTVAGVVDWRAWERNGRGTATDWVPEQALDLQRRLEAAGWDTSSASFETGAPVRIRVVADGKKSR
jgi:hypothetical protein